MSEAAIDRDEVLLHAAEHGTASAAERFGVPAGTIRSWRSRAERKVTDLRARDPARARLLPECVLGGVLISQSPNHDLRVPERVAVTLKAGEIVLLRSKDYAAFGDAVWEIVKRAGKWRDKYPYRASFSRPVHESATLSGPLGAAALAYEEPTSYAPTAQDPDLQAGWALLIVRPARVRPGQRVSEDGTHLERDTTADERWAAYQRDQDAARATRLDPWHDREKIREQRERAMALRR